MSEPVGMGEADYAAYRRRLTAVFVLRVLGACAIVAIWDGLDTTRKILAIVAAAVVVPGLGTLRKMFRPYERYVRESAPLTPEGPRAQTRREV